MRRSRRRVICSTNSASSSSETILSPRTRSRTSSACGDCFELIKPQKNLVNDINFKTFRKYNMRSSCNNLRSKKKKIERMNRTRSPIYGALKNTIVLAPFHTLKRTFQAKLVDMYTQEQMKKINHRMKMSKKPNYNFEYVIVELKPLKQKNLKKETKLTKASQKEKKVKRKRSRSQTFCHCKKKEFKSKTPESTIEKQESEQNFQQFCSTVTNKKRRLNTQFVSNTSENELRALEPNSFSKTNENLCPELEPSDISMSALNSKSKKSSWETFSDSQSCRERHLQGPAISVSSFDSCMEQLPKDSCNFERRPMNIQKSLKMRKEKQIKKKVLNTGANFMLKQKGSDLIKSLRPMNSDSDEQIVDFMDREPQTNSIFSEETSHNLRPLRRQSKTEAKSQKQPNDVKTYYLRSAESSKEKIPDLEKDNQKHSHFSTKKSKTKVEIEGGTQVEFNNNNSGHEQMKNKQKNMACNPKISDSFSQTTSSSKPPQVFLSNSKSSEPIEASPNSQNNNEPQLKVLHHCLSQKILANNENNTKTSEVESEKKTENCKSPDDDSWNGQVIEPIVQIQEPPDPDSNSIQPTLEKETMETSDVHQTQDKESDFIFGNRNSTARLGESCEFSFGLNWVFSDEEDSDHSDRFC